MSTQINTIHTFEDSGEAYDASQCDDDIHDGDVLVCDDGVVGFLYKAWPIAVTEKYGEFHYIDGVTPDEYLSDKGPQHRDGYARACAEALRLGFPLRG